MDKNKAAVELGRMGGKKTAQKGADYFRRIAAMRTAKKGGRKRKNGQ